LPSFTVDTPLFIFSVLRALAVLETAPEAAFGRMLVAQLSGLLLCFWAERDFMGEPVEAGQRGAAPAQIVAEAVHAAKSDLTGSPAFREDRELIPSTTTSSLLAGAGGFLDGFTYVGHGHVFATAMTGNVVLLGVNCISGDWGSALRHMWPIVAFLIGILAAKAIQLDVVQRRIRLPYLSVLALELGILLVLSFLPISTPAVWITTSVAFAASVQAETFRKVNGKSYNSTFTTGNLRTLSEGIFDWVFGGRSVESARVTRDFAFICLSFLVGAMAGAFAAPRIGNRALWIDCLPLLVVAWRVRPRQVKLA
jgi:uncharacterized membrane protein YoaK (UPF0700 family)